MFRESVYASVQILRCDRGEVDLSQSRAGDCHRSASQLLSLSRLLCRVVSCRVARTGLGEDEVAWN